MLNTRRLTVLALVAGSFGVAVSVASPAAADVSCADLKTQDAAQAYFEGRAGDPDGLDADADGRACEHNDSGTPGNWTLVALGTLLVGGLVRFATDARRQTRRRPVATPAEQAPVLVPAQARARVEHQEDGDMPGKRHTRPAVAAASGSLGELARALRLVPYAKRMPLLEEHARVHGSAPQDVLDALAEHTSDLELQGWALAGYDPPWFVRPMHCSCVDGLRNYRLQSAPDGTRFWACATCHSPDRHLS